MKLYELVLGIMQLLIFLFSWILFKLGYDAWVSFLVAIIISFLMVIARLLLVKKLVGLPIKEFLIQTIIPLSGMMIISFLFTFFIYKVFPTNLISVFIQIFLSVVVTIVSMYFIGLNRNQRIQITSFVITKIRNKVK